MNTAAHSPCQTSGSRGLARTCVIFALALALVSGGAADSARSDEPPAWRRELDAARLAEATVAAFPAGQDKETASRLDELYRQLARRYPDQSAVRKAAGDHFWRAGQTDLAVAEWRAAQALDPSDADTASALGSARLRAGEVRQAREQFQRAVDIRPGVASYHFDLANVLFIFRHQLVGTPALPDANAAVREALAQFRRASELAPENAAYAQAYAETFYGVPDPDWSLASDAWTRVRALKAAAPDFANGHLARISLYLGKPDQADEYLALIQGPGFGPLKATIHRQAAEMRDRAAPLPAAQH